MKALTFKKTVLATALFAVAGAANAADPKVFYGTVAETAVTAAPSGNTNLDTLNGDAFTTAYGLVAKQNAISGAYGFTTASQNRVIGVQSGARALGDNDLVTFTFTNGGLDANQTFKLMIPTDFAENAGGADTGRNLVDLSTNVFTSEASNGVIRSITFRTNNALTANADANDFFYLVAGGASDNGTDNDGTVDFGTNSGVTLVAAEGISTGAAISVEVSIDYQSSDSDDVNQGSITLARAFDGVAFTTNSSVTDTIDFTNEAMSLVNSDEQVVTGALGLAHKTTSGALANGYDWDNDGDVDANDNADTVGSASAITPVLSTGTLSATATLTFDNCAFIDVSDDATEDGVIFGSTAATKSTTADCTWSGAIADSNTVTVNLDGETTLSAASATIDYIVRLGSTTERTASKTLISWTSDVQKVSGQSLYFPYVTALNDSSSTFTFMKVDNTGVSKDTSVVMSGTVEQFTRVDGEWVSEQFEFSNYKLATLPAGELSSIRGDDVIDALLDPKGSAEFGFVTEALEGIDKEKLQHIAVTFEVASAETSSGAFGSVEAFQSATAGRTQINLGGQNDNLATASALSTLTGKVDVIDGNVDDIEAGIATCISTANTALTTANTTFATATTAFDTASTTFSTAQDAFAVDTTDDTAAATFNTASIAYEAAVDTYQAAVTAHNTAVTTFSTAAAACAQ